MKSNLKFFVLFVLLSLLLFWPIFFGKVNLNGNLLVSFYGPWGENLPFKNTGWDQLRIYFPFLRVTLDAVKNFEVPLWNPYAFSGHPHMADFQSAVFYPLNIFGFVTSQVVFWHFLRITPQVLAAFFTYLYLRSLRPFDSAQGQLSNLASLFGALAFGFSPFILTWGEEVVMAPHSIVWLPLILYGIDRFKDSGRRKFLALIALVLAASLLAGYMQTTIYLGVFAALYFLLRFKKRAFSKRGVLVITAFIFGGFIAAVQLMPSGELYFRSARAQVALTEQLYGFLLPASSIITYLAPDFFGHPATGNFSRGGSAQYYEGIMFVGVAALIFAVWGFLKTRRSPLTLFLVTFGLVALLTTIDWPISRLFLRLPIPFLSTSIANRILFIPAFCIAVLAALGFNAWQKSSDRKIMRAVLIIGILYLGLLAWLLAVKALGVFYFEHAKFYSADNWRVSFRNLALPLFIFTLTAVAVYFAQKQKISKNLAAVLIIAVSFLHIFYFAQKYFSFTDRKYVFPKEEVLNFILENQGNFRTWGAGQAFLENNFASQYGIYFAEGYDSLNNRRYAEFTYAMQGNRISDFIFRADAGVGRAGAAELAANAQRRRLIDLLGIKYVIARETDEAVLEASNFKKVFADGSGTSVFENRQVVARAFLASGYEKVEGDEEIIKRLLGDDFNLLESLVLEQDSPTSPQAGEGKVEVVSYRPQEVTIRTKSDAPKLLFISDNFYPGWKAQVDGDETEILRADYTFRAVPLTAGEHTVRFYFDSGSFKWGLVISLGSLAVLGFYVKNRGKNLHPLPNCTSLRRPTS